MSFEKKISEDSLRLFLTAAVRTVITRLFYTTKKHRVYKIVFALSEQLCSFIVRSTDLNFYAAKGTQQWNVGHF